MLGRKDYTQEELDNGRAAVTAQLAGFKKLKSPPDGFETMFFNSMVLVLDRLYVHRIRPVAGKDANALNEVELICDSLMNSGRVFRGNKVLEYIADQSAIGLEIGDQIRRTAADFAKLSTAFFAVLEGRFVAA